MSLTPFYLNANGPERPGVTANLHAAIDRLPSDKDWKVEITRHRKEQSDKQLGALFGVAYKVIMQAVGLEGDAEKKELHKNMCGDFFGWTDKPMIGRIPVRTTTKNEHGKRDVIDTETQARMYDFIQRKAAEYGIQVPDPDPLWFRKRKTA